MIQQPNPTGHGQEVSLAQVQVRMPAELGSWQVQ